VQGTQTQPLLFNPFDPAFRVDPYPTYERLRREAPIFEGPFGSLVLSRYAECEAILRDPRSSSDFRNSTAFEELIAANPDADQNVGFFAQTRPFLFLDPPDHTRLRGLVNKAFTPRAIEALRGRIQEIVNELLDRAEAKGEIDIVEEFAYLVPVQVICEMMGVPIEDHGKFREWSRELARSLDPEELLPPDVIERRQIAVDSFGEYFGGLIAEHKAKPREDLLGGLLPAEESGDKLTEMELLATCILLLVAGHETTVNLIGNGTLALLRHPDQLARLREDPSLARSAVEEFLRFDPPVQFTGRVALEDMTSGKVSLKKGQQTILLLASANRDPDVFSDPDRLDIARTENRHLAFSHGIHYCVGAPLARLEGEIALGTLVQRFAGIRLLTEAPAYKENIVLRGLAALPVAFG